MAEKDKNLLSSRGEEILRARREKTTTPSVNEVRVNQRISQDLSDMDKMISNTSISLDKRLEAISGIQARVDELKKLSASLASPRMYSAEKSFQSSMRTALGSRMTGEDISRYRHASSTTGSSITAASGLSTNTIEERIQQRSVELGRQDERIREAVSTLEPGQSDRAIRGMMGQRERMMRDIGINQSALQTQKKLGLDTRSQYFEAADITQKMRSTQFEKDIREDVRAGKGGSASDAQAQLDVASRKLIVTFEKFDAAIKAGTKDADELAKEFNKVKEEVDKSNIQLDEHRRSGGGGRGSLISAIGGGLENLGTGVQAGGAMYRQWGIQREMDTSRLQTGFLNIANQRFQDSQAAAGGDMSAVLRIQRGSYGKAFGFAGEMAGKEVNASKAEMIGGATSTIGSMLKGGVAGAAGGAMLGSVVPGLGTGVGAVLGGIGGVISAGASGVTQTSGRIAELQSGAVQASMYQQAFATKMAEDTARQAMDAAVLQRSMDFTRGSWKSSSGSGSSRSGINDRTRGVEFQRLMANSYALSQEDVLGLTQAGIGSLGKQFRTSDIGRAGAFSNAGMGSPEQYMAMRGQISKAGGSDRDMETILRNAVASGMDSSKNIADMTNTMTRIASSSSAGGVSTLGGAAARVASTVEALKMSGVPENMRADSAAKIGDQYSGILNQRKVDIPSLVQSAALFNKLGLRSGTLAGEAAAKMKPEQIQALLTKLQDPSTTDEQKRKAIDDAGQGTWKGLADDLKSAPEKLKTLSGIARQKVVSDITQAYAYGSKEGALLNKAALSPESLTEAEKKEANKIYAATGAARFGVPNEKLDATIAYGDLNNVASLGKMTGSPKDVGFQADQAGALGGVTEYAAGLKLINNNFTEILATMKNEATNLDPEKFKDIFKASTGPLDDSVAKLARTVEALNLKLQGKNDDASKMLRDNANTDQDGTFPGRSVR